MGALHFTLDSFDKEVIKSPGAALVDFWAEWCGPCKMIAPVIDQLADEYQGKIKIGKVNVDDNQELAMKYQVMSIPTLIIFKNGKPVDQIIGAVSKDHLVGKIKSHL